MSDREYVITVKREHRSAMPDNWMGAIERLEGVEVLSGDDRFQMMRIKASDGALEKIREEFSDWLHIEERSDHETKE